MGSGLFTAFNRRLYGAALLAGSQGIRHTCCKLALCAERQIGVKAWSIQSC